MSVTVTLSSCHKSWEIIWIFFFLKRKRPCLYQVITTWKLTNNKVSTFFLYWIISYKAIIIVIPGFTPDVKELVALVWNIVDVQDTTFGPRLVM